MAQSKRSGISPLGVSSADEAKALPKEKMISDRLFRASLGRYGPQTEKGFCFFFQKRRFVPFVPPCLSLDEGCETIRALGQPRGRNDAAAAKWRKTMSLRINSEAPNFVAETTMGTIDFHQWIGDGWAILFSHPKDFTPVCTTELGYMAGLKPEFDKRNTKIIGLSVDPVANHAKWAADIEETQGHAVNYPMIGDTKLEVATKYDMLPEGAGTTSEGRTAADNATVRSVFVIGPDKKVKAMLTYPMTTGRNFDEVLRILDSVQLNARHSVATPVNWRPGDDVIIPPAISDEAAKAKFPQGWKTLKPYLRVMSQPKD
jgi:alkyl hydroperoxide reductase subunit AhpC